MNRTEVELRQCTPLELIEYILRRYHDPLPEQIMQLEKQTTRLAIEHGFELPVLSQIVKLLRELWVELEPHLLKEERVLFPMLHAVFSAKSVGNPMLPSPSQIMNGPVRVMLMEHDRADEILRALAETTEHYTPPTSAKEGLRSLYDGLRTLDTELHEHIRIENELLFPAISRLSLTK